MGPHYQTVSVNCSHLRFTALNILLRIGGCVMMLKMTAYSSCETSVSVVRGFSQVMLYKSGGVKGRGLHPLMKSQHCYGEL